jgi:hypothetical protein
MPRRRLPEKRFQRAARSLGSPALLGHSTGGGDLATDGPDEARELARNRGDGDSLEIAPSDQRPVTPVRATLRLPGDLANRARGGLGC